MCKYIFSGVGVLLLAVMAWAGDVWKDKPFDQWTEKDVLAVLQYSPWAKANLAAAGAWHPPGSAALTGPTPGSVAGTGTDVSRSTKGAASETASGYEKNANAGPQTYNVYWWSSRTIRAAFVRYAVLKGKTKPEDAPKMIEQPMDDYEILVQGRNMYVFQQRGEKFFQGSDAAFLEMKKSKEKLAPSSVVFQFGPDGKSVSGVVFHFSKKDKTGEPTIGPDEKEVDLYLHIGDLMLRTYFEPKKMVGAKGEDL